MKENKTITSLVSNRGDKTSYLITDEIRLKELIYYDKSVAGPQWTDIRL